MSVHLCDGGFWGQCEGEPEGKYKGDGESEGKGEVERDGDRHKRVHFITTTIAMMSTITKNYYHHRN